MLEVSLRKAGYSVAACADAKSALEMLELSKPDLILSDTRLPGTDGFELAQKIRASAEWADIPFMFLSSDLTVESKVRGLEQGVEDYLTKPIYIKEIIARVNLVLQRRQRRGLEERNATGKTRFTGSLADMGIVDLLQTIDNGKKSGVLHLRTDTQTAAIYFRDGSIVDAELGTLRGERAIYRALVWSEGSFELDFRDVRREAVVSNSTQGVLMEGMRRLDEWGRMAEQLPQLDTVFEVNAEELLARLAEIPDEINAILRQFDGKRTLIDVVDRCDQDDLETLSAVSKLYFEGLVVQPDPNAVPSARPSRRSDVVRGMGDLQTGLVPLLLPVEAAARAASERPEADGHPPSVVPLGRVTPEATHDQPTVIPPGNDAHEAADADTDMVPGRGTGMTVPPGRFRNGPGANAQPAHAPSREAGPSETWDFEPHDVAEGSAAGNASDKQTESAEGMEGARARKGRRWKPLRENGTLRGLKAPVLAPPAPEPAHEPPAPIEAGAEVNAPIDPATALRARKKLRRRKRLSLASSPGLLSAVDPLQESPSPDEAQENSAHAPREETFAEALEARPSLEAARGPVMRDSVPREPAVRDEGGSVRVSRTQLIQPPVFESTKAITHVMGGGDTWRALPVMSAQAFAEAVAEERAAFSANALGEVPQGQWIEGLNGPLSDPPPSAPQARQSASQVATTRSTAPQPPPPPTHASSSGNTNAPRASTIIKTDTGFVSTYSTTAKMAQMPGTPRPVPPIPPRRQESESSAKWVISALIVAVILLGAAIAYRTIEPARDDSELGQPGLGAQAPMPEPEAASPIAEGQAPQAALPTQAEPVEAAPATEVVEDTPFAAPVANAGSQASATAMLANGRALERAGKRDEALKLYERALAVAPNDPALLARMAFNHLNRGDNKNAEEYAARATAVDPTSSEAWIVLGAARDGLANRAGAREAYKRCVDIGRGEYVAECKRMIR